MGLQYYYFPRSHWSRVVSFVLCEKGLWTEAEREVVDIRRNENFEPRYLAINPKGVVPTVVIDGEPVCNTPVIVRALDLYRGPPVHPNDPVVDQWAKALEGVKLMHLSYHTWTLGLKGERSAHILDDKVKRAARYAKENPELADEYERKRAFFETFRDQVYDDEHREKTRAETLAFLSKLAEHVRTNRWIAGDMWTWPDALATSILWRLEDLNSGLAPWKDDRNHPLAAYFDRLKERPGFRTVYFDDPSLVDL